jgi:hypothetical protein
MATERQLEPLGVHRQDVDAAPLLTGQSERRGIGD